MSTREKVEEKPENTSSTLFRACRIGSVTVQALASPCEVSSQTTVRLFV